MTSVVLPAAVLAEARATAHVVTVATGVDVDAAEALGGRAALLGLPRGGTVSAGGATRLMGAADGWCALTLARPDDLDAVPALVEADHTSDPWAAVREAIRATGVHAVAARARLLGLPVGVLGETDPAPPVVRTAGARAHPRPLCELLVADLSSMWAGPLCGRLLARAGATVVKVESPHRPDGTRAGPAPFFDWVNNEKLSYAVDFAQPEGLVRLLAAADVVLESSRPSALHGRGLGHADVPARAGRIWVQITGHGAVGERAHWVAFGDDAAVSGGLVGGTPAAPAFCGDAIADPLTGLEAARAVLESHARGGGEVIGVAMAAVAARYAALPRGDETLCTTGVSVTGSAARLGEHNALVDEMVARRLAPAC
ncbi:CoA transferase [Mycolicibacterium psychrotolerans]|uniref:CoA transferase n=1 Tax=Mycolicibacterium psychrotolerans TaxID=216929 RepID=A0A7I7M744_9MYCO|nr:CoA transferase [Mycolicibacterium psychrotolerans]BBX67199.1 CoA transferase [Mycolicibacterium psychrotolerans]